MTPGLSFVVTAVLLFAAVTTMTSAAIALGRPRLLGRIRSASLRADIAWLLGVLPPTVALVFVVR